jgi:hypothetical protein
MLHSPGCSLRPGVGWQNERLVPRLQDRLHLAAPLIPLKYPGYGLVPTLNTQA